MRLLVSGATRTIAELLAHGHYGPLARARLGHLVTPAAGNSIERMLETGLPIAVDNGAYAYHQAGQPFDWPGYVRYVARVVELCRTTALRERLLWLAMPDAVGDARGTARRSGAWLYAMPSGAADLPWAWVAQDGAGARCPLPGDPRFGPFVGAAAVFVGGSTAYKESGAALDLAASARAWGRLVHVGRVNSWRRAQMWDGAAHTFDGGKFSMFPATYIPRWLDMLSWRQGRLLDAA